MTALAHHDGRSAVFAEYPEADIHLGWKNLPLVETSSDIQRFADRRFAALDCIAKNGDD